MLTHVHSYVPVIHGYVWYLQLIYFFFYSRIDSLPETYPQCLKLELRIGAGDARMCMCIHGRSMVDVFYLLNSHQRSNGLPERLWYRYRRPSPIQRLIMLIDHSRADMTGWFLQLFTWAIVLFCALFIEHMVCTYSQENYASGDAAEKLDGEYTPWSSYSAVHTSGWLFGTDLGKYLPSGPGAIPLLRSISLEPNRKSQRISGDRKSQSDTFRDGYPGSCWSLAQFGTVSWRNIKPVGLAQKIHSVHFQKLRSKCAFGWKNLYPSLYVCSSRVGDKLAHDDIPSSSNRHTTRRPSIVFKLYLDLW